MLLARAGFDLLRSAAFKQRAHAHIQKKLDVLRIPEYIQSIEVGGCLSSRYHTVHTSCRRKSLGLPQIR